MTTDYPALRQEAHHLACQLFEDKAEKVDSFTDRLLDIYARARDKDFLIIHNPGGWGSNTFEHCLQWERNIVNGVSETVEHLGHTRLLIQYMRSSNGWWDKLRDIREQFRFFATKARIMAAELEFITRHVNGLKVVIIGVSQGAAFTNSVMQKLDNQHQVYSIELGFFFPYMPYRVITEKTLAIDSNGFVPDAAVRRDLMAGARAYMAAPFRWLVHLLRGRPVKFSNCINVRGHDYDWGYPYVRRRVTSFLETNFGTNNR
ncbi:hypothetical protein ACFLYR_04730 [Chloroflexota bacterium]